MAGIEPVCVVPVPYIYDLLTENDVILMPVCVAGTEPVCVVPDPRPGDRPTPAHRPLHRRGHRHL